MNRRYFSLFLRGTPGAVPNGVLRPRGDSHPRYRCVRPRGARVSLTGKGESGYVDPAYTSRTCAGCGHIDRANRVSQARFACRSCGFVDHADRHGSRNIRAGAWELWRRGARPTAPAPPPAPAGRGWTRTQHPSR
ncbi:zinc ribbon domain-containing protein [Streptomyces sp. KMM 9044]|nr:transposase [Streptomyces sp. KMM 9044]WAX80445.1 zinc ribbon domain-containing protein [Streptomyces sp. KMM 9044]